MVRYHARGENLGGFFARQILVAGLVAQFEVLGGDVHDILGVVGDVDLQRILVDQDVRVFHVDGDAAQPMLDDFIVETCGIGLDAALIDGLGFRANDTEGNVREQGATEGIGETDIDGVQGTGKDAAQFPLVHGRRNLGQRLRLLGG